MISTSEHIDVSRKTGVLTLTMNRPKKKNALTQDMYAALADNILAAQGDPDIRVIVLTGTADAFTAGNDLSDFTVADAPDTNEIPPVKRFLNAILKAEKPLIAAVNGLAIGVGVTMLLHCALVYASPNATFQTPFVNLGLVPEAGSSLLLPRLIGTQKANDLLLLGTKIGAEEAERIGLIAGVFEAEDLLSEVVDRARVLATKAPTAVRLTKSLVRHDRDVIATQMAAEGQHFASQLQTAEFTEAVTAFMESRAPDFSNM